MKHLTPFILILCSLFVSITFNSCTKENITDSPEVNKYQVTLNFGGEMPEVEYTPLSRVGSSDLIGIQVYSCPESDVNGMSYAPCAFGLFDTMENMTLGLLEGYKYKFTATLLVDAKNKLAGFGNYFSLPFEVQNQLNIDLTMNNFMLSNDSYYTSLATGRTYMTSGYYDYPTIDRYYGETLDYIPEENGKVTIEMKRVVFGVKYIIKGMTEGSLKVTMKDAPELIVPYNATNPGAAVSTETMIHSFSSIYGAYSNDNFQESLPITFVWAKETGEIPQGTFTFDFKRKQVTTITFSVTEEDLLDNGMNINIEGGDLINGNEFYVENGEVVDTEIDPTN
jgi:hypothetical protein